MSAKTERREAQAEAQRTMLADVIEQASAIQESAVDELATLNNPNVSNAFGWIGKLRNKCDGLAESVADHVNTIRMYDNAGPMEAMKHDAARPKHHRRSRR